jgi:hypothetical protein
MCVGSCDDDRRLTAQFRSIPPWLAFRQHGPLRIIWSCPGISNLGVTAGRVVKSLLCLISKDVQGSKGLKPRLTQVVKSSPTTVRLATQCGKRPGRARQEQLPRRCFRLYVPSTRLAKAAREVAGWAHRTSGERVREQGLGYVPRPSFKGELRNTPGRVAGAPACPVPSCSASGRQRSSAMCAPCPLAALPLSSLAGRASPTVKAREESCMGGYRRIFFTDRRWFTFTGGESVCFDMHVRSTFGGGSFGAGESTSCACTKGLVGGNQDPMRRKRRSWADLPKSWNRHEEVQSLCLLVHNSASFRSLSRARGSFRCLMTVLYSISSSLSA